MSDQMKLLAWIKKDQEERRSHQQKMAAKNYREDNEFIRLISFLVHNWSKLKIKEREFICSMARWHDEQRCFTPSQRSVVTGLYMKYCA